MRVLFFLIFGLLPGLLAAWQPAGEASGGGQFLKVSDVENVIVRYRQDEFSAWPANNGIWSWKSGNEILVGFTFGKYNISTAGHRISEPKNSLARSRDGGKTWETFTPENFADENLEAMPLREKINFRARGFVMRVSGMGYHGNNIKEPNFYYSYDKGSTWRGPFLFNGIDNMEQLRGMTFITPRTDYIVTGRNDCIFFVSATTGAFKDKTFMIRTTDGGMSFSFVSWVVPPSDPYRAVMSQTVFSEKNRLVSLLRRRDLPGKPTECWIDAYASEDGGVSWSFLSKVADTGFGNSNGNPPTFTRLKDGRLIAVYGNRGLRLMLFRLSEDNGRTWGPEIIIRDDFIDDGHGFADFGYPRVTERRDGKIVAIYYFATEELPQQHIVCSIFSLDYLK